jgi:hypothetical protein
MQRTNAPAQTRSRQPAHASLDKSNPTTHASRAAATQTPSFDAGARCPCGGGCPRCSARGSSEPLGAGVRRSLESSYGADFGDVRVHTGPGAHEFARAEQANAVTSGSDIYFARDRYAPETADGWQRIAHEVAHVVQQRNGRATGPATYASAETEARQGAMLAFTGQSAAISQQSAGLLQRDDDKTSTPDTPAPTPASPAPDYQLHLDPEIQRMALQYYLRWWVGTTLTSGIPSAGATDASTAAPTDATTTPTDAPTAAPTPDVSTLPPPLAPWRAQMPIQPNFYEPIDPTIIHPDMSALMAPYLARGVPLDSRDADAANAIFQKNFQFVTGLPDLRSMAPSFIRPLIPTTWRKSMAESFTAATMNAQLKHDFPTAIEAADLSFQRITGVSTTYIPLPGFSF